MSLLYLKDPFLSKLSCIPSFPMTLEPISRELPHRLRTMDHDVKPLVKSQWKSLLRPKHGQKDPSNIFSCAKSDQIPWPRSEGPIDMSEPWILTSFTNGEDTPCSVDCPSTQSNSDPQAVEEAHYVDDSGVLLNRWLYANPSELPPPPLPDKIALDDETRCTLGPPRQNDYDMQTCSPDSGYCSFDSNPSASAPTSLGLKKRFYYEPDDSIDNFNNRCDDRIVTWDSLSCARSEGRGSGSLGPGLPRSHDVAAPSSNGDLLVSSCSARSRAASVLQSVVGSQTESSLTDSTLVYDVDDELVRAMLNHQLLQRLMEKFYSLPNSILRTSTHTQSTSPSRRASKASTTSSSNSSSFLSQNSSPRNGKGRGNGSEPPDDDQEKDSRRKRRRNGESLGKLYACPFYKYDPRKYACGTEPRSKFRICTGPGFTSIARLKQHLRRAHTPPPQCRRCWKAFSDEPALELHARSTNPCQVLDKEVVEGISKIKFELLSRHGVNWNEIYHIIFPGAPLPTSCYHDTSEPPVSSSIQHHSASSLELAPYEAYTRTELPRLVEAMLEGMIRAETEPLEEKLKPLLVDVVRSCQSTLTHRWQSMGATASPSPPLQQSLQETPDPGADSQFNYQDNGHQSQMYIPSVVTSAYQEPPLWDTDMSMSVFEPFGTAQTLPSIAEHGSGSGNAIQSQVSSSEYFCRCHQAVDYSGTSGSQMLHMSTYSPFPSFRPSLGDLQAKKVIRCSICGGWQFT